jgi:hypothetical protein
VPIYGATSLPLRGERTAFFAGAAAAAGKPACSWMFGSMFSGITPIDSYEVGLRTAKRASDLAVSAKFSFVARSVLGLSFENCPMFDPCSGRSGLSCGTSRLPNEAGGESAAPTREAT